MMGQTVLFRIIKLSSIILNELAMNEREMEHTIISSVKEAVNLKTESPLEDTTESPLKILIYDQS